MNLQAFRKKFHTRSYLHLPNYTGVFFHLRMHVGETTVILLLPCYPLQWLSFTLRGKKITATSWSKRL